MNIEKSHKSARVCAMF